MRRVLAVLSILACLVAGSAFVAPLGCSVGFIGPAEDPPYIYVSVVVHNEEGADYINDVALFNQERQAVIDFATMLDEENAMLNWQSDWRFLRAVQQHDTGAGTGGENIVEWLHGMGFEVDPHAHESIYNYADVAHLISELGVTPSGIVGGFVADPPESSLLERFWIPIQGSQFPAQSWQAQALWGAATADHVNDAPLWASGIWKPQDNEHFMTHDNGAPLPHIGKYGNTWAHLDELIDKQMTGQLDPYAMYTATVFATQASLKGPNFVENFRTALQQRDGDGYLIWVGLSEALDEWEDEFSYAWNIETYVAK
ncbi:MAG: hypothetical protein GY851_13285 [bacterium]|nr:hypothetical protein [bacterium]